MIQLILICHYTKTRKDDKALFFFMLGISAKSYRDKELGHQQFTQDEMFKLSDIFNAKLEDIFLPRKYQNGTKKK